MAQKYPPSASSSEEEREVEEEEEEEVNNKEDETDDSSEEESGGADEESEKSRFHVVPNSNPKSKYGEEEDTDDDSESDEQNPIENEEQVKKPNHTSVPAKRPAAEKPQVEADKFKKRRKKNDDAGEQSEKRQSRVWTEEGEIVLLKGLANYNKKGKSPNSDSNGFYEFIKGSINADVSKDQLSSKIRHARTRFLQNEAKENNGEVLNFSKPHFEKCYELSKTIWAGEKKKGKHGKIIEGKDGEGETAGVDGEKKKKGKHGKMKEGKDGEGEATGVDGVATTSAGEKKIGKHGKIKEGKDGEGETTGVDGVATGKSKKSKKQKASSAADVSEKRDETAIADDVEREEGFGLTELIRFKEQMIKAPPGLENFLNKSAFRLIEPSRGKAFEKKWKDLQVEEMELFMKRIDLVREYTSMVSEALKSPTS